MNNIEKRRRRFMGSQAEYYQKILSMFGSSLIAYWPLWETSGTVATDISGNARNGTYYGATLNNILSMSGKPSPYFDGNDYVNIYSTGMHDAFNGDEGVVSIKSKVPTAQLTDGAGRRFVELYMDASNRILIYKGSANNSIAINLTIGGVAYEIGLSQFVETGWFTATLTWSKVGNFIKAFYGGSLMYTAPFSGTLPPIIAARIGSSVGASNYLIGGVSDLIMANRAITDTEAQILHQSGYYTKISFIGDSIGTDNSFSFARGVVMGYGGKRNTYTNHAVGGAAIITTSGAPPDMAEQVASTASDDADIIIVELGANDNNAGDMVALQDEYEINIAALKISNPRARIYSMNVLPRWTDIGGGTETDKSNIRVAVAAACTAQGITCWDTRTDPWITSADTLDGTHPIAAGAIKISNRILGLLPA